MIHLHSGIYQPIFDIFSRSKRRWIDEVLYFANTLRTCRWVRIQTNRRYVSRGVGVLAPEGVKAAPHGMVHWLVEQPKRRRQSNGRGPEPANRVREARSAKLRSRTSDPTNFRFCSEFQNQQAYDLQISKKQIDISVNWIK